MLQRSSARQIAARRGPSLIGLACRSRHGSRRRPSFSASHSWLHRFLLYCIRTSLRTLRWSDTDHSPACQGKAPPPTWRCCVRIVGTPLELALSTVAEMEREADALKARLSKVKRCLALHSQSG